MTNDQLQIINKMRWDKELIQILYDRYLYRTNAFPGSALGLCTTIFELQALKEISEMEGKILRCILRQNIRPYRWYLSVFNLPNRKDHNNDTYYFNYYWHKSQVKRRIKFLKYLLKKE